MDQISFLLCSDFLIKEILLPSAKDRLEIGIIIIREWLLFMGGYDANRGGHKGL